MRPAITPYNSIYHFRKVKIISSNFILLSITKMKNTTVLKLLWWEYNLTLTTDNYRNNGRTYLWLVDASDWEPFADISENHVEIDDEEIFNTLPGHEAIVIDQDFRQLFGSERDCKIWLRDNFPDLVVITGDLEWRPVFYIKNTKQHD